MQVWNTSRAGGALLRKHVLACIAALAPLTVVRAILMSEKAVKIPPPGILPTPEPLQRRGETLNGSKENKNSRIEVEEKPTVRCIQVVRIQGEEK